MNNDIIMHYDKLMDENNDPVNDPQRLKTYMDQWDGPLFIEKLELDCTKSVLEIGVGTGRLAVGISPVCKSFVGIDLSPKTIARAKKHLCDNRNVTLICDDFCTYEFKDRFDVIYSSLTFMHIENKQNAMEKVYRLLKPSGRFVLSIDKNRDHFIDYGTRKIMIYPDHPDDTEQYLKQAGFSVVETPETKFAYLFVAVKE